MRRLQQVNQVAYELPGSAYANPWSYEPEFMKVFADTKAHIGESVVFDCVLLGTPRPKVSTCTSHVAKST